MGTTDHRRLHFKSVQVFQYKQGVLSSVSVIVVGASAAQQRCGRAGLRPEAFDLVQVLPFGIFFLQAGGASKSGTCPPATTVTYPLSLSCVPYAVATNTDGKKWVRCYLRMCSAFQSISCLLFQFFLSFEISALLHLNARLLITIL
jgi:hypothetical protein